MTLGKFDEVLKYYLMFTKLTADPEIEVNTDNWRGGGGREGAGQDSVVDTSPVGAAKLSFQNISCRPEDHPTSSG